MPQQQQEQQQHHEQVRSPKWSIADAFGLSIFLLRLAGIFPFNFDERTQRFHISYRLMALTVLHLAIYTYVNATLLLDNWEVYVQPLVGTSLLTMSGNLLVRLLGVVISYMVLLSVLFDSWGYMAILNRFMRLMYWNQRLGIDDSSIYRKIRWIGPLMTIIMMAVVGFNSWHSIYFYREITQEAPTFRYYVVVAMSDFYIAIYLFRIWMLMLMVLLISLKMNSYMMRLVRYHREQYLTDCERNQAPLPGASKDYFKH